jgi:hypothetical protein
MNNKKTDWKSKYYELRSRYMNAIDVSFRLGFQEGQKVSELQNMQTQLQQAQQAAAAGGMPGGEMPPEMGGGMPPEAAGGEMPPEMGAMPVEGGEEGMPAEGMPEEGGEEEVGAEEDEEDLAAPGGVPPAGQATELDASIQQLEEVVSKNEKIDFSKLMKNLHKSSVNQKSASEISDKHKKIEDILKKW